MSTRGYVEWRPSARTATWLQAVAEVLIEYRDEWPLTIRQVFYRLVETHGYEKSEPAYGALVRIIGRARRASLAPDANELSIPFEAIRDGGLSHSIDPHFYADGPDFRGAVWSAAERFRLDRQDGQQQRIEFWCEAGGMLPILAQAADRYGIKVTTGGGYDSLPLRHELACRARDRADENVRTLVLHVGDFDPSGENMCDVLREDAGEMTYQQTCQDGWLTVERIALTESQVIEYGVQTAPPKPLDSRMRAFLIRHSELADRLGTDHITAQLEALTPPQLRALFETAVESRFDRERYETVLAAEEPIRDELLRDLDAAGFRP